MILPLQWPHSPNRYVMFLFFTIQIIVLRVFSVVRYMTIGAYLCQSRVEWYLILSCRYARWFHQEHVLAELQEQVSFRGQAIAQINSPLGWPPGLFASACSFDPSLPCLHDVPTIRCWESRKCAAALGACWAGSYQFSLQVHIQGWTPEGEPHRKVGMGQTWRKPMTNPFLTKFICSQSKTLMFS